MLIRLGQIAYPVPIGRAGASKPVRKTRYFGRAHFVLSKRQTPLGLQVFSQISKTMKKTVNPKYYHKHHCTCNIFIKFTYLMASELLYLPMDWEIFNYLPALEAGEVRGAIIALQTATMVPLAITSTFLAKRCFAGSRTSLCRLIHYSS